MITRLPPARPCGPLAPYLNVLPATSDAVDPGLELARDGEIVHGRADHDDVGIEELVQRGRARGKVGAEFRRRRRTLRGGEVGSGEVGERGLGQVAIDDVERRRRLPQTIDDGGGNLPADGVGAEHAGVDVEEFH